MAIELSKKIGDMNYDGIVTGLIPEVIVSGGTFSAVAENTLVKRGTLLVKVAGKLKVYTGVESEPADCILCDDTTIGATETPAVVYIGGCFDPDKLILGGGTITEAVKDMLRTKGIVLKAAQKM
jgi:hypothetical protein|nr:MAG TPA: Head decoration protein, Viral protein.5A [Caudoviricetes sp.]